MKNLLFIALVAFALSSCNTQKSLQRAINKHGQKESIAYVVKKYPEYFKSTIIRDTIHDTIEVVVPEYKYETVIEFDSASVIENEKLKIEITRLKNGKISVKAKCKTDTIYYPNTKIVEVECPPCPDADKLTLQKDETDMQVLYKYTAWIAWIIILLVILYKVFSNPKHNYMRNQNSPDEPNKTE